jgi:glutaminase
MINAGAIAISSAIRSACGDAALDKMLAWFGAFAGRSLSIDDTVYRSESETGHRNRAIAHLLRNFGIVGDPVEAGLDLYFRQCSILVTCRDLAVLGATLANRGTNPTTGERALAPDHVDDVLSVMTTCGMYNYAGQWLHEVGLPAKSGVAGGIVAVLPGRLGIGVFSPRLDPQGNSVRGIAVCKELSDRFRLHLFDAPRAGRAAVRIQSTLARRQSTRVRPDADVARLRDAGAATHVLELQGDLGFAAMETIHRRAWAIAPKAETLVFDISRIDSADETAAEFFGALVSRLTASGKRVAVAGLPPKNPLCRHLVSRCEPTAIFPALDAALEACEESLLTGRPLSAAQPATDGAIPLSGLEMAQGLDARSLAKLGGYLRQERFAAGQRLFAKGDEAQQIYFLSEGTVSVRLYTGSSTFQRLATFSAGSVFGEMAVVDRGRRSSDVWAETNVTSFTLSTKDYDRLGEEQPHIKFRLLEYLIRILSSRLRKANEQIAALSG